MSESVSSAATLPSTEVLSNPLPPELLHMVFKLVDDRDIPSLRLTCRSFAEVGLDYQFKEPQIRFTPESLNRMLDLTADPKLRFRIKALVYKVDCLKKYDNISDWELEVRSAHNADTIVPPPQPVDGNSLTFDDIMQRQDKVADTVREKFSHTSHQIQAAWEKYQTLYEEQQMFRDSDSATKQVATIISRLPNLKSFALSNFGNLAQDKSLNERFSTETFMQAVGDTGHGQPCGVTQLMGAFRALHQTGIQLQRMYFGTVDWRIFQVEDSDFELMKSIVSNLVIFETDITTNQGLLNLFPVNVYPSPELEQCTAFLKHGRAVDLLKSMPKLRQLSLSFDHPHATKKINLRVLVGDLRWSCLTNLYLINIGSTEQYLLGFFRKHSSTLEFVEISNYRLYSGKWSSVLRGVRTSLRLKNFCSVGFLLNDNHKNDSWYVTCVKFAGDPPAMLPIGDHIRKYVVGGSDDTPIDLSNYVRGNLLKAW
ncbi:MAG: hypothetical protein LQ337_005553 [Flavoplaca oasis]|nr:MAG: hypothetical protein LQ337_005553 [Flavoplaca oasis]